MGSIIGIPGKKLYRWYKEVLSGFRDDETKAELHKYDTVDPSLTDKSTGEVKAVEVPILKEENFGKDMALDDKNIGGVGYSILSNKETKKIAFMASTTKAAILIKILSRISAKVLFSVKTISKDLASGYDWVARAVFMNAMRIADKFHVLKLAFEALQDIRVYYRQQILSSERKQREEMKGKERKRKELCFKKGEVYVPRKFKPLPQKRYGNGETKKEILARGRYLLFRMEKDWSESQKERSVILFNLFPKIKIAYELICQFRKFYSSKIGDIEKAKQLLDEWYRRVEEEDIDEINNFASLVERHEGEILNYFHEGHTNAYAESLNSIIENFVNANSGTRDRDFFHFRLKQYFT